MPIENYNDWGPQKISMRSDENNCAWGQLKTILIDVEKKIIIIEVN